MEFIAPVCKQCVIVSEFRDMKRAVLCHYLEKRRTENSESYSQVPKDQLRSSNRQIRRAPSATSLGRRKVNYEKWVEGSYNTSAPTIPEMASSDIHPFFFFLNNEEVKEMCTGVVQGPHKRIVRQRNTKPRRPVR